MGDIMKKLVLALLWVLCLPLSANAAPVTYVFNYSVVEGQGSAVGYATFDDALLAPNSSIFEFTDKTGLDDFSLQVSNFGGGQPQCFRLSDLSGWVLVTDQGGQITDLNFFMYQELGQGTVLRPNPEGYAVTGIEVFTLGFYDDPTDDPFSEFVSTFEAAPRRAMGQPEPCGSTPVASVPVPTLGHGGLGIALLVLLLTGGLALRRKA
jgi:hypothetical protein